MRHLKQLFVFALISLFSVGAWADTPAAAGTTLFSEDFSSYAANAVPSGSVTTGTGRVVYGDANVTYSCADNGSNKTMIYTANLAGGTSPELLVGKSAGVFTVAGIPSGDAQEITVSFKQNAQKLTVSLSGTGYSTEYASPKPAAAGTVSFDITVADGADATFTLIMSAGSSNVRVDDILITVKTAGEGAGTPKCATPTFSPAAGSYEGTQNVTISSTTGATIYYTTDGSDPTTSGTKLTYSDPIAVSATTTLKAYATLTSYDDSEVGEAAYTITEGPDVTINLLDDAWGFPTSKVVDETSYTDGVYTLKVAGTTGNGFRTYGTYFMLGQSGAYLELPEFADPIEKIVVTGNSGGSGSVTWNIFKGDDAVSTEATGCKSDAYTFNIDPVEANVVYRIKVTSAANLQIKTIKIYFGEAPAVAKPTISGDENFVTSTTVTLACSTTGAEIYYTTDGSDPKASGSIGTSFSLTETKTVRAIAKLGSDWSEEATPKTFTKVDALESLAALLDATTSTETAFNVVISNWVVTGVSGSRAWIADAANEKGILLYKSGHNFVAGNKLNGVVIGTKSKLYQGYPELTSLVSTDVTVTTAETVTPRVTTIAALTSGYNKEQGTVVKLENLTYTASTTSFSDGVNTLALNTQLYNPTMLDGAIYTIIGVVRYDNEAAISIMPRSVDDVEQTGGGGMPEVDGLAALKAETTGSSYLLNLTDAIVTLVDGSNAFIEDATAGALIYKSSHGFSAGDKLNGQYEVTTSTFQGKFEITAITATTGTKTADAEIPVTTLTIAQLNANFAANESKRIKIVGVNVTDAVESGDATARTGEISDGENTITLYAGKSGVTAAENANIDVIGYPTFHNTDQQLAVWAQTDITVNEKDPAGIAFTPESETITGGDPWSAPAFANPNSLTVTFSGDNDAVATVNTTTGEITLEGGYGTAVITAHTDGDATHAAGNATYTITVNDPGATPVYTMSFDLTRASYDDAADEEVVWNSNVVTITAQKNTGTKVTNYLAGNYSGTTLIAETRLYENNILAFTPKAGVTITKVEWHATAKAYAESLAKEGTTTAWTNATAALDGTDDKLVIITPSAAGEFSAVLGKSGSNKGTRALNVVVYYQAESEKAKLTASISIDDMNMAVGDDDILLSAIAATSNPNKKAISYAVTSGTAVTIEGTGAEAALHAAAEGSATITATIPDDLGNYTGATTSFTVAVSAAATLESIAISGTATELEYTEGQSFNPAGLTVMGHYSNGSDEEITSGIDWTFAPDPLTEGTTSVSVTATVETISSDAIVVNGLTVSGPAPVGDNYVKVTASQADWSGDYLLVYEDGTDAYVWNGDYSDGANNYASATISSNTIAKPAAAAVITIAAASEGKYTLQVNGDKYFQDNGSNSKLIFTDAIADAAEVTISYETDWTQLLFSERCIRFNSNSGQTRFRFYAASSQQAVQLYKKEAPTPDYTRDVTVGKIGTLCVPYNVEAGNAQGAVFYQIAGSEGNNIVFDEVTSLKAGEPYIFQATATTISLIYSSIHVDDPVAVNGMIGSFSGENVAITESNKTNILYIAKNALYDCSDLVGGSLEVVENRCYINRANVTPAHAPAHGARRISLSKDVATGFDQLDASETPMKLIMDGQLYILRGEKLYDATGRLVK